MKNIVLLNFLLIYLYVNEIPYVLAMAILLNSLFILNVFVFKSLRKHSSTFIFHLIKSNFSAK